MFTAIYTSSDLVHLSDDGKTTLCGQPLGDGEVFVESAPVNCIHCDSRFLNDLGNACLQGPLPVETQKVLMAIAFRYQHRYNKLLAAAHDLLDAGIANMVDTYPAFCESYPKPLTFWQRWARDALWTMGRRCIKAPEEQKSLEAILKSGTEPYHTLKGFVNAINKKDY
jgi:hypothetical protein